MTGAIIYNRTNIIITNNRTFMSFFKTLDTKQSLFVTQAVTLGLRKEALNYHN